MSDIKVPWDKLGIPDAMRANVHADAPRPMRLAAAKGALPATPEVQLAVLYVLACDADAQLRDAAIATLKELPNLVTAINQRTHPKVLELLAEVRPERALDEKIMIVRNANDRTSLMIAARADAALCEMIAENHDRLLITPDVVVTLYNNPACAEAPLERAIGFLRMQQCLPDMPAARPKKGQAPPAPAAPAAVEIDLEAEIQAALSGKASPMLEQRKKLEMFDLGKGGGGGPLAAFSFDFKDEAEFGLDMIGDGDDSVSDADKISIEKRIAEMTPGKKIKLAYLGNKTVRAILIRDRNKQVSVAVVKAGRMSDAEATACAGNRNLASECLREIANNKEWMRRYPLKVALANNPKTPPNITVGLVPQLQQKDLASLARNKNVSSVIFQMAGKLAKQKGGGE